jgi:hypothetical protein
MRCPSCGGTQREAIAPGYWRCTSTVATVNAAPGPGAANPAYGPAVIGREEHRVCGFTYQEGTRTLNQLCECGSNGRCGTFAVGRCVECDRFVCGDHSARHDDQRLCREHWRAAMSRQSDAAAHATASREAAQQQAWEDWRAACQQTLGGLDRIGRIVCVVGSFTGGYPTTRVDWNAVRTLLPELLETVTGEPDPMTSSLWSGDAVAAWFLENVREPPTAPEIRIEYQRLGGALPPSYSREPGWCFTRVAILATGRLRPAEGVSLIPADLKSMAELCHLPALPGPPR